MAATASAGRRWLAAVAIAVAVVAATTTLFRWPRSVDVPETVKTPRPVTLARNADELLTEEAALRDPTPLFLPTKWNTSENALLADVRRDLGSSFRGYEPKWRFTGSELELPLPAAIDVPQRGADVLATEKLAKPFVSFGQQEAQIQPLAGRGAFVEVATAGTGQSLLAQPLADARPPGEAVWQPLEFLVAVNASGLVGAPVLTTSSQVAAVDTYFRDYLVRTLHLGQRLPPGFYRVEIGP
jgi:hypothetical protein